MNHLLRIILIFVFSLYFNSLVNAQELNCNVQVNSSQVTGSDKSIFDVMQKAIYEFMNNRKWTNHVYSNQERIECTILINITEQVSVGSFKATIQVQSRRPVFNSSYNSTLLNHIDRDFEFTFNEFDQLDYSETTFISNLTSTLSFYAYMILALDYDSFELNGGTQNLIKAQTIVTNAQSAPNTGWKAFEDTKNRYWMAENYLKPNYAELRKTFYNYHRLGFDIMTKDASEGRKVVFNSLKNLESVFNYDMNSFQLQLFFNAKKDELIDLFKEAQPSEKAEVVLLLKRINPANGNDYEKILKK
ncbi:DUF4835 family protein [Vicingus serpentipes]|jgi:uncharacterized protein DUF4835|uniref:DUF4835 family protein n=1 Tax=Vicingus serpentipes TaxID=1926625 RepID=A0A5C6RWU6_9FLAO|nr:DUF4835 family protein [Vicingus serpentipes]TXB65822.1 DUF4835 family protein [Vicingus serpentipes]